MARPSLTKNSLFNVLYQLVLVVVPLLSSMYTSRVVLPSALGDYSVANNLVSYFTALAPLGLSAYGVREIAKASDGDLRFFNRTFSELFLINLMSTVAFLLAYAVCVLLMFGTVVPSLYLIFGSLIVANALNVEWFFQGIERYDYISIRGTIVRLICFLLTVLLVRGPHDVSLYAAITCLGTFFNYIVNVLCLRGRVKFEFRNLRLGRHMKPLLVLAGTSMLFTLYTKIDVTMMGAFCSSAIVAYYVYAYNAEEIAKTLCTSLTNVYLPRLSYEFSTCKDEFSRLVRQSMVLNLYFALPMSIGVMVLAPRVVAVLFGDAFEPAGFTLRLFALLIFAKSVGNVIYQTTIATGNERFQLIAYSVGVLINIGINAVLIPVFAQNGAVLATIITEVALDVVLFSALREHFRMHISVQYWISVFVPLGIMLALLCVCNAFIASNLLCLIVAVPFAAMLYASFTVLLKNEVALLLLRKVRQILK